MSLTDNSILKDWYRRASTKYAEIEPRIEKVLHSNSRHDTIAVREAILDCRQAIKDLGDQFFVLERIFSGDLTHDNISSIFPCFHRAVGKYGLASLRIERALHSNSRHDAIAVREAILDCRRAIKDLGDQFFILEHFVSNMRQY